MPRLTRSGVEKEKPDKHVRKEIADSGSPGLYLIIQPGTGAKSWAMRFRNPVGRQQKLTLGPCDLSDRPADQMPVVGQPLDLIGARRLASEIQRRRAQGQDVVATYHRERLERLAGYERTFGAACLDFTRQHLQQRIRRWQASERMLGIVPDSEGELQILPKSICHRWADRPLVEITSDDLHHVIDEAVERGIPGLRRSGNRRSAAQGRVLYALLSRFC